VALWGGRGGGPPPPPHTTFSDNAGISALFYQSLTVLIVIPNKPLGDVRNLIALHCIAL
jgi:hypothetical protein